MAAGVAATGEVSAPPSWSELRTRALATPTGSQARRDDDERARGYGPPHRASKLRLFGAESAEDVRVTLYRDSAAWCPYCQKLWIMLEEKQIPYKVELINMRSYGDKPKSFLAKCPRGLLPALELDGKLYTESLEIMAMVDSVFAGPAHRSMLPPRGSKDFQLLDDLLRLERSLFSAWCGYVFRSGTSGRQAFDRVLKQVDHALGEFQDTPWFLNFTDGPSLVDLQYVTHIERMVASVPYWKGHALRGPGADYPNIERWFQAFEQRPAYVATRSDWYTHVKDIPPQYGDGQEVRDCLAIKEALDGGDAAWQLPLPPLATSTAPSDVLQPGWEPFEEGAPHEAAYRVVANHEAIVRFMARGAGTPGGWAVGRPDRAELADPYAKPAEGTVVEETDIALRAAVAVLLDGSAPTKNHQTMLIGITRSREVANCAAYLRDRVGVPRDMSYPAARCLRGSMNWVMSCL
eukprot:TRINITY_DN61492_c0_g1_i1.p1 TRINITY_DN61492_c0_g1~~TRINITY_DN61492_c0_g1_i1.p1  ORF type:complete len:497 (-),score=61.53 TRINITY_DN61492_c0_g1_i1:81-1469(-)